MITNPEGKKPEVITLPKHLDGRLLYSTSKFGANLADSAMSTILGLPLKVLQARALSLLSNA